jgi:hypothetical protein
MRMAATCGSKAVVERPWKEDDQSIDESLLPLLPNDGDVLWTAWTNSLAPSVGGVAEEVDAWGVGIVGSGSREVSTSSTDMALNVRWGPFPGLAARLLYAGGLEEAAGVVDLR